MTTEESGGDITGDRIVEDAADDFGFARAGGQEPDFVGSQQAFHADGQTPGGNAGVTDVFGGGGHSLGVEFGAANGCPVRCQVRSCRGVR
jgi:hypothetical protein